MPGRTSSGARRYCPKCAMPMWPMELQSVKVDLCMKCQGMWFDRGELAKASGAKFQDRASAQVLREAKKQRHACPDCAIALYERPLVRHSRIMIDQCPRCSGLFLDKGEYSAARKSLRDRARRSRKARKGLRDAAPLDEDSEGLVLLQWLTGLPLELDVPQKLFSPVVTLLIALNVVVLVLAYVYGLADYIRELGLVPADVGAGRRLHTFLTSMFMHAGVAHLLGNMYFLFVAGDNLEEHFGWAGFLGFYLLCGVVASITHVAFQPGSSIPTVGASGAISGVIGAYVALFPRNRFLMRWFYFFWHHVKFELPAYVYFGLWIALQVVFASLDVPGVAWWAHIGGFTCGVLVALGVRAYEHSRAEAA